MSNYKVGDLASLFPSPPVREFKKNKTSNFTEKISKGNKNINEKVKQKKVRKDFENSLSHIASVPEKNLQQQNVSFGDSDNQNQSFKRSSQRKPDQVGFIRSKKNKKLTHFVNSVRNTNDFQVAEETDFSAESGRQNQKLKKPSKKRKFESSDISDLYIKNNSRDGVNGLFQDIENADNQIKNSKKKQKKIFSDIDPKIHTKNLKKPKQNKANNINFIQSNQNKKLKSRQSDFIDLKIENQSAEMKNDLCQNLENADKKLKKKKNKSSNSLDNFTIKKENVEKQYDKDDMLCTLFAGNLPMSITRKGLEKLFSRFGPVKTVRLRCAISIKDSIPKKVAEIKNEYHEGLQSRKGFVVFKDRESAANALVLNGTLFDDHHIIVNFASQSGEKKMYDEDRSIFVGNLPFGVSDETVWSTFETCGEIHAVRVIRDRNSGLGKGFGYVQFQDLESKRRALEMENLEIHGRKLRVKSIDNKAPQKEGSKESLKMIRNKMAMKRSKESGGKKSVKKLLKKGRRLHHNKQVARMLGQKFAK